MSKLFSLNKERRAIRREMVQVGDSIRKFAGEFRLTQTEVGVFPAPKKTGKKDPGRFFK